MTRLVPTAIGTLLAVGTYAFLVQLINTEACYSVARIYESFTVAKIFAQVVLACI